MEHLPVHLPYEAQLCGPVQYRWMYPFERFLGKLKKNVRNKARVEGSICNAYLVEEASYFCSYYFADNVRKCSRNPDDTPPVDPSLLSIFKFPGKAMGASFSRRLNDQEYHAARTYILLNCQEVKPYISLYEQNLHLQNPTISASEVDQKLEEEFALWFQIYANDRRLSNVQDERIKNLASGPLRNITVYSGYYVNGLRFHVAERDSQRVTNNSGVCVKGSTNNNVNQFDYYGRLEEIIEVEYPALPFKRCVLFRCSWYDPTPRTGTRIHRLYNLVEVNGLKRFNKFEPFIFAVQASQTMYLEYPTKRRRPSEWLAVCQIKARSTIEMPIPNIGQNLDAFQNEEIEIHSVDSEIHSTSQMLVDVNVPFEDIDDGDNSDSEEDDVPLESSDENLQNVNVIDSE